MIEELSKKKKKKKKKIWQIFFILYLKKYNILLVKKKTQKQKTFAWTLRAEDVRKLENKRSFGTNPSCDVIAPNHPIYKI